jgi:hypothetical protein
MLRRSPQLTPLPTSATGGVCFAVDLVVERHDAPRVAARGGTVDVVNVVELGDDDAGRRVRFIVEADLGEAPFDVQLIVAVDGREETIAGPRVPARSARE